MLREHSKSFSRVLPTSRVVYHAGKPKCGLLLIYSTRAREIFVRYSPRKHKRMSMLPCLPLVGIYLHSPSHQVSMYHLTTCQTLWNKQHKRISRPDIEQDEEPFLMLVIESNIGFSCYTMRCELFYEIGKTFRSRLENPQI